MGTKLRQYTTGCWTPLFNFRCVIYFRQMSRHRLLLRQWPAAASFWIIDRCKSGLRMFIAQSLRILSVVAKSSRIVLRYKVVYPKQGEYHFFWVTIYPLMDGVSVLVLPPIRQTKISLEEHTYYRIWKHRQCSSWDSGIVQIIELDAQLATGIFSL